MTVTRKPAEIGVLAYPDARAVVYGLVDLFELAQGSTMPMRAPSAACS